MKVCSSTEMGAQGASHLGTGDHGPNTDRSRPRSVAVNALVVIESGVNLLDGWQPGNKCWYRPVRLRENRQFLAEHLLNFRLQMGVFRCN
jgi:hypothetical protein